MPASTIELLEEGRKANHADRYRRYGFVCPPEAGRVVIAGDLHGHRRNFERIRSYADLEDNPDNHVVLQEIIHGGPTDEQGGCLSFELLFDVVRYKLEFPDRVHLIMGNHDTAFITESEVMKDGKEMNAAFRQALERRYKGDAELIILRIKQFLFSQPLVVKCPNGIWVSHSLPDDRSVDEFDPSAFERELKIGDVNKPGTAYFFCWGRRHSKEAIEKLAEMLDVMLFVVGHQHQEQGYSRKGHRLLIIASDHGHGVLLPVQAGRSYTMDELVDCIVPLASLE